MAATKRLLVVGWDGAGWPDIHPLLDQGALPALERLVEGGASGALAGLSPPIPQVVWTSLATGLRANRHGVTGALEVRPDRGGVQPIGRRSWRAPALWETLSTAGVKTAVIGWPATWPASRWPGVMIDDGFARFRNEPAEDWPMPRGAASPPALRQTIAELRVHPSEIDAGQIMHFIPDLATIDPNSDKRPLKVAIALAETASIHAAATYVMAKEEWELCVIRYPLLARIAGEPSYRFLDMMLGRLLTLAGEGTRAIVVSPNGLLHTGATLPDGIFVAAGPGIRPDMIIHGASLLDVCPTVLAMFGTSAPCDGRALAEIFESPPVPASAAAPCASLNAALLHEPASGLDPAAAQLVDDARFTSRLVLGEAELASDEPAAAANWFEAASRQRPDDFAVLLRLAFCCIRLADKVRLRTVGDRLVAIEPQSPWSHLVIGAGKALCGEADAGAHFAQAAQRGGQDPMVHLWLGEVALRLEQHAAAESHYRAALALAPQLAPAAANLGIVRLARGDAPEAENLLRRALALRYHWPAVHRRLAETLTLQGRAQESAAALETATRQEGSDRKSDATPIAEPLV